MSHNAQQFLQGVNAVEVEQVKILRKYITEARDWKKKDCVTNLNVELKFSTEGDIATRIDSFIFQITIIVVDASINRWA